MKYRGGMCYRRFGTGRIDARAQESLSWRAVLDLMWDTLYQKVVSLRKLSIKSSIKGMLSVIWESMDVTSLI
jgi:uncharacterized ubiquitin-like protein YukD